MVESHTANVKRFAKLLFVTSTAAIEKMGKKEFVEIKSLVPKEHWIEIKGSPNIPKEAAEPVWPHLSKDIDGVVILGDNQTMPSQFMNTASKDLRQELRKAKVRVDYDLDNWYVWSDDIYGQPPDAKTPTHAVSRIPVVPTGGFVGDAFDYKAEGARSLCVRATDFPFADDICNILAPKPTCPIVISPPSSRSGPPVSGRWVAEPLNQGSLTTDRLYLVLHSEDSRIPQFTGGNATGESPIAIDSWVLGGDWQEPGVVMAGACWGALTADQPPGAMMVDSPYLSRQVDESVALNFVQRGSNAFVGFTALHYLPKADDYREIYGQPLHRLFWENLLVLGMSPAKALFQARVRFLLESRARNSNPLSKAIDQKTYWSATCLGMGW